MADYGTIVLQYNTGTDLAPNWSGTAIALGGSAGANELRMAMSGGTQTATTGSGVWPFMTRPLSGTASVNQLWAFSTDTIGLQIATYTGDNSKANVIRWNFDALGNPLTQMQVSFYEDSTHTAPSAGTQPPGASNDAFTNGSADTSNTSYIKGNCYGSGLTAAGVPEIPSAGTIGTLPTATTGSAGAAIPAAGSWLTTWQSLQGATQYLQGTAVPKTTTSFSWYHSIIIFLGVNISTGIWTVVYDLTYTYA